MTNLRQAAKAVLDRWDSPLWKTGATAAAIADLRTALTREHAMHDLARLGQEIEQQAEPGQWRDMVVVNLVREGVNKHKARELADHFAAPPQQQAEPVAWDKPSASFNAWWDSDYHDPANPFAEGSAAYWAWAGWKSAQRQWVGLTDEDLEFWTGELSQGELSRGVIRAVANHLKEKNSD